MVEQKQITTSYNQYGAIADLPKEDQHLLETARRNCKKAYAPYSKFYVGAAIRTQSGKIINGANQENASFPIGACAERVAIYQHSMNHQDDPVVAIAVTAELPDNEISNPVTPCGSCRQLLVELENKQQQPIRVILYGTRGSIVVFDAAVSLLPLSFDAEVFLRK